MSSHSKLVPLLLFFLLAIFLFLYFYTPLETEDGWWHLSAGRWMVEHHQVPREDVFSSSPVKSPWVYTQWLGSLIFYGIERLAGNEGLKVFRSLFFMLTVGLFVIRGYKKIPLPFLILLVLILAHGLFSRCLIRPLVFNFLFIQLFLINIFAYLKTSDAKRLLVLPLLGVLWVNIHLGSFVYGLFLIVVVLLAKGWEYLLIKWRGEGRSHSMPVLKQVNGLFLAAIGYLLIMLLNPYGVEGALYPFRVFLFPDFIQYYEISKVIEEMQSPWNLVRTTAGILYIILFLSGIAALLFNKKNSSVFWALFAFSAFIFFQGAQGGVFFVIVGIYIVMECLAGNSVLQKWQQGASSVKINYFLSLVLIPALSLKIFFLANTGVLFQEYAVPNPVGAVEFLKKRNMEGLVFNDEKFGGYLLWSAYPKLKPFVDGRQLDKKRFFDDYLAVARQPEVRWPAVEKEFRFTIVLLDKTAPYLNPLIEYLKDLNSWQLVYEDGSCVVFNKKITASIHFPVLVAPDSIQVRRFPMLGSEGHRLRPLGNSCSFPG